MTASTEQLHQLLELVLTELDRKAIPIAYMQDIDRKGKAFIEQAARRAPVVPQDVEKMREELAEETEAADSWRRLALQFDNHRMQVLWHMKRILHPDSSVDEYKAAEEFLKAPPLDGEAVLAQRIAALAAPVPQGWKLVPNESTDAMARAFRADDAPYYFTMTTLKCNDFPERWRAALGAAPQPPEACQAHAACDTQAYCRSVMRCTAMDGKRAQAAPVQLPEPQAEIKVRSMKTYLDLSIHEWRDTLPDGTYKVYTEQQVRQLLAAQEQST